MDLNNILILEKCQYPRRIWNRNMSYYANSCAFTVVSCLESDNQQLTTNNNRSCSSLLMKEVNDQPLVSDAF